jgi:3-dehydroquinate synthase
MIDRELLGSPLRIGVGVLRDVGALAVARAPASVYAIVTDETVGALPIAAVVEAGLRVAAPTSRVLTQRIPPGERQKSRGQWGALTDWLLAQACGRDTTVIALGGGVVGDLAGFVAATYLRGVPLVQLPTTLVAMVDAAIGGKTGVDTPAGKNLVGAFHRPALVLIDPSVLATLPVEHIRAGLAEVLKHGVIADNPYFHSAARHAADLARATESAAQSWWRTEAACDLIVRSVEIKSEIVAADERESGRRESLNFGHTVAHAIEVVSEFTMLHGHAVAIGMVAEAMVGEALGMTLPDTAALIRDALDAAQLPTRLPSHFDVGQLIGAMRTDKKARAGETRCAIPRSIGTMMPVNGSWSVVTPRSALVAVLRALADRAPVIVGSR